MTVQDEALHKIVREIRDAADSALECWSDPEIRAQQIGDAIQAATAMMPPNPDSLIQAARTGEAFIWFAENGNVRKWSRTPFKEGERYILSPVEPGKPEP